MSEYWDMVKSAISENREIVKENKQYAVEHPEIKSDGILTKLKNFQAVDAETTYDDKLEVPVGTKTLLGNDFSSLYESCSTDSITSKNSDGADLTVDVLKSTCSYPTEMHTAILSSASWSNYDTLSPAQKAAYEVTLLSKKYATMSDSTETATEYATVMANYRQYCDQNGIVWNDVVQTASNELQLEVSDYQVETQDKLNVYEQIGRNAAKSKAQSAEAHNLLLSCAPEGYQDQTAPGMDSSVSYEDTCDATYDNSPIAHAAGFFVVVNGVFSAIYDKLPHLGSWAKSVFNNLKNEGQNFANNTEALMEDWDQQSDARLQEYSEVGDQLQGIKEDVSNTAPGQVVEDAGDKLSEEIPQAFEDPSQPIQDGRDWLKDKYQQAEPYIDAAGNALKSAGEKAKGYADDFVDKWSTPDTTDQNAVESEDYQP